MHAQMKERMDAEGLPYAPGERVINSRIAQEVGKWADQKGHPEIHELLYRAHHAEGIDISDPKALIAIAAKVGLDPAEAARVISERRMKAAIDEDWEKSTSVGVTGVPTFIAAGRAVVGAQPYEMLEKLAKLAGAKPNTAPTAKA